MTTSDFLEASKPEPTPLRVLISYSWEGRAHEDWVVQLATRIRRMGFDVRLDRWHRENRESLTQFMEREVRDANCILAVLTPQYAERANARGAGGVPYEFGIIAGLIHQGEGHRLAQIVRRGSHNIRDADCAVPTALLGRYLIDFRDDGSFEERLDALRLELLGLPALAPPPIGEPPAVATRVDTRALGVTAAPVLSAPRDVQVTVQAALASQLADVSAVLAADAGNDLARMRARWREGRRREVLEWLRKFDTEPKRLRVLPSATAGAILRFSAGIVLESGRAAAEAASVLDRARAIDPTGDDARLRAVLAWRQHGVARGLAILDAEARRGPADQNLRAGLQLQAGEIDAALALLADDIVYCDLELRSTSMDAAVSVAGARGALQDLQYEAGIENVSITVERARLQALAYLAHGDVVAAQAALEAPSRLAPDWSSVRYVRAIVAYFSGLVRETRPLALPAWPEPVDVGLVGRDPVAHSAFESAAAGFAELLNRDPDPEEREVLEAWRLAALANQIEIPELAICYARSLLERDPAHPFAILWAAYRSYPIELEQPLQALAERLRRSADLGDMVCYASATLALGRGAAAAELLDELREHFEAKGLDSVWRYWRAHAALVLGQDNQADALAANLPEMARRAVHGARLRVLATRTGDPALLLAHLDTVYAETGYAPALLEAAVLRARSGDWAPVAEQAGLLEERVDTVEARRLAAFALFNTRQFARAAAVATRGLSHSENPSTRPDWLRLRAQALAAQGDVPAAIRDLDDVVAASPETADLLRLAHLHATIGNELQVAALAQDLRDRADLRGEDALRLARVVAMVNSELARDLWRIALARNLPDDAVGAAMDLAMRLGLDGETRVLTERLAMLAPEGRGGIRQISMSELMEQASVWHARRRELLEKYARGELPVHAVATHLNWPLVQLYHMALLDPPAGVPSAEGFALRLRHGGRGVVGGDVALAPGRLALDTTSLLLAEHLGVLEDVEALLAPLLVPHGIMRALYNERECVAPVQPSQLAVHRALLEAHATGSVRPRMSELPPLSPAEKDAAKGWSDRLALLKLAQEQGAYVLDFAPVEELPGGRLAETAGADRIARVATPRALIDALERDGELTSQAAANLLDRMGTSGERDATGRTALPPHRGATVFALEGALCALVEAGVLPTIARHFNVLVEPDQQQESRRVLDAADRAAQVRAWVDGLIYRVSAGLERGTYRLLPGREHPAPATMGPATEALADLIGLEAGVVDAVWIDDRFANRFRFVGQARIVDAMEVLAFVEAAGRIDSARRRAMLVRLWAGNARYLPVAAADLAAELTAAPVEQGQVSETRSLSAVRRSLAASLADRGSLQLPFGVGLAQSDLGEMPFLLNAVRVGIDALVAVWRAGSDAGLDTARAAGLAEARSQWIVDEVYLDFGLSRAAVVHPGIPPEAVVTAAGLAGMLAYGMTLLDLNAPNPRAAEDAWARRYVAWVWRAIVEPRLALDPDLRAHVVECLRSYLWQGGADAEESPADGPSSARAAAILLARRLLTSRLVDIMPDALRPDLLADPALREFVAQDVRETFSDGTHHFPVDDFLLACATAINGATTEVTAVDGTLVRVEPADAPASFQLRAPDGTTVLGDRSFRVLATDPAVRAEAIATERLALDLTQSQTEDLIEKVQVTHDLRPRLALVQERRTASLVGRYARFTSRAVREHTFEFGDLIPPNQEALCAHLRLPPDLVGGCEDQEIWESTAISLIADVGWIEAYQRLAVLPIQLPRAMLDDLSAHDESERRKVIQAVLRARTGPVALAHALYLLGALAEREPLYGRMARLLVRQVATPEWDSEVRLLKRLVAHAVEHLEREGATGDRGSMSLLAAWYHAGRLLHGFIVSGAEREGLAAVLGRQRVRDWTHAFRRDRPGWFDVAHPRHVRTDRLAVATLLYAFAGQTPVPWTEALSELMGERLTTAVDGGKRHLRLGLLLDTSALENSLRSFLPVDRRGATAAFIAERLPFLASPPSQVALIEEAVAKLDQVPADLGAWVSLHVGAEDAPLAPELETQVLETLRQTDLSIIAPSLGDSVLLPIMVVCQRLGRFGTADDRARIREQLVRLSVESAPIQHADATREATAAPAALKPLDSAVLEGALALARGDADVNAAVRSFGELAAGLGAADARWWARMRPALESLVRSLPLNLAHWLTPTLLAARAASAKPLYALSENVEEDGGDID